MNGHGIADICVAATKICMRVQTRVESIKLPQIGTGQEAQGKPSDCHLSEFSLPPQCVWGACLYMSSNEQYRTNAEDCLRMARTVENDSERPFWLSLAQSWLQLAEKHSRVNRSGSWPWQWSRIESEW